MTDRSGSDAPLAKYEYTRQAGKQDERWDEAHQREIVQAVVKRRAGSRGDNLDPRGDTPSS